MVGDFDSISDTAKASLGPDILFPIPEQLTTDFDKALRSVEAAFTLALGFTGARIDHGLAVFNALVRHHHRRCIVIGPRDVVFHAPPALDLALTPGDRFSLYPMAPVTGRSTGLEWPIDGIAFAPDGMIGTRTASPTVTSGSRPTPPDCWSSCPAPVWTRAQIGFWGRAGGGLPLRHRAQPFAVMMYRPEETITAIPAHVIAFGKSPRSG